MSHCYLTFNFVIDFPFCFYEYVKLLVICSPGALAREPQSLISYYITWSSYSLLARYIIILMFQFHFNKYLWSVPCLYNYWWVSV